MKPALLFVLLFLFALDSYSQDWAPFNLKERFNYRRDSANIISANFFVDSVKTSGTDSIFFLDRIIKDLPQTNQTLYALKNQPQFWQRTMIRRANGDYNFLDPGNFLLTANRTIGNNWIFDSLKSIIATIDTIEVQNIFNNADSVAIISLSNHDTIKLSKHYGLIYFPEDYSYQGYLTLTGIEGRNLGEQMPNFNSIFNFNIDDIFVNDNEGCGYVSGFPMGNYTVSWFKILKKDYIPDSAFIYQVLMGDTNVWSSCYAEIPRILTGMQAPLTFNVHDYEWLNRTYCNSYIDAAQFEVYTGTADTVSIARMNTIVDNYNYGRRAIYTRTIYVPQINNCLSCNDTIISIQMDFSINYEYAEGLGLVANDVVVFENNGYNDLICYGNTDSSSNTCGDVYYDDINEISMPSLSVYPNPFSDKLYISSSGAKRDIVVYNLLGQVVLSQTGSTDQYINTGNLLRGSYIIEIRREGEVSRSMVTKM